MSGRRISRSSAASGVNAGTVYAVDNRGFERAVQVNADAGSFRKVLPSDTAFRQGDACSFKIADDAGYLFDAETGARLSHLGGAAG